MVLTVNKLPVTNVVEILLVTACNPARECNLNKIHVQSATISYCSIEL